MDNISYYPYKPSFLFVGHWQTVQNAESDQVLLCLRTKVLLELNKN